MASANDTSKELLDYFQAAKPDCLVLMEWKDGLSYCRFYFDKNNEHAYIIDVGRDDTESGFSTVKKQLEEAQWQDTLMVNAGKAVSVFKDGAFAATVPWPIKYKPSR